MNPISIRYYRTNKIRTNKDKYIGIIWHAIDSRGSSIEDIQKQLEKIIDGANSVDEYQYILNNLVDVLGQANEFGYIFKRRISKTRPRGLDDVLYYDDLIRTMIKK